MWQQLMDWLPDYNRASRLEVGSLTDLLGLIVGCVVLGLTVWIARRQFQIMNRQTTMMVEQSEASKRMEAITKRQGEIAELQHEVLKDSMYAAATVEVWMQNDVASDDDDWETFGIWLANKSQHTIDNCKWSFTFRGKSIAEKIVIRGMTSDVVAPDLSEADPFEWYTWHGVSHHLGIKAAASELLVVVDVSSELYATRTDGPRCDWRAEINYGAVRRTFNGSVVLSRSERSCS
jgi:hypothetical protein